ncbi:MAG TPA: folate family ECF transporter S component [Candidatus Scybalocola faecigallinarum]|uniref:Folate family ECF transporter S component n=1 Tax=Candidatus Scybalocola faecigallinarum TaxID=2840941 RepID=A0A9D1F4X2_9FIRM|nr:folate family ECF transporter S component [Candidatus Scybalocola faecigallinarum]
MTKTTQKIAILGMLVAAQVIAGRFISISLPIVTIGFVFLPVSITGILFGPLLGGLSAFLGDLITALLGPYGYFLPMGLSAFLTGAIYSLFLHRKPASIRRIIACVLTESILISVFLQTFWLTILTGKAYLVLLPTRIIQNLITIPVSVICIWLVSYRVVRFMPEDFRIPAPAESTAAGAFFQRLPMHRKNR